MFKRIWAYIKSEYTWSANARRLDAEYRKRPASARDVHIDRYEWECDKREHLRERKRVIARALLVLFAIACVAYAVGYAMR
jgi:hypothetical protein